MRILTAAALAIAAVALVVMGGPPLVSAMRARYAAVTNCGDDLLAVPSGTWVRLSGCGVDMFHPSFLVDANGERSHRLVPLRPAGQSSAELSGIALAMPVASDPKAYQAAPGPDSEQTQVANLADTTGVVLNDLAGSSSQVAPFPGFETGLARDATLIELRTVPGLRRSATLLAAAGLCLGIAVAVFFYRPAPGVMRAPVLKDSPLRNVRWSLVLVLTLVGIVGMWRVLLERFDPMQQPPPRPSAPAPRRPPIDRTAVAPAAPPLPPPSPQQLTELVSPDPAVQLRAAGMLLRSGITPELITTVDAALARKPAKELEERLICIKSRDSGPGTLDFLLARFPAGDWKALNWTLAPDVSCLLDALIARTAEAPEQIRDAILPAIYAENYGTKDKVLKAFRSMNLPDIPQSLVVEASTKGAPHQRDAMLAAIALGAVRLEPGLMTAGLKNYNTQSAVAQELRTNPHVNAARLTALAASSPQNSLVALARDREMQFHDVSSALLEIVLDTNQTEAQRASSAYQLGRLGEVGPLPQLRTLSAGLGPGALKTAVDGAIKQLEDLVKHGVKPRMRPLAS